MRQLLPAALLCALSSGSAYAQVSGAHAGHAVPDAGGTDLNLLAIPPPELENRPRSHFENSLMGEIGCMCETCELEPINACHCEFAARMRGEVLAELDTYDVSTETGRHVAADSVRASLIATYGPKVLRHQPGLDAPAAIAAVVIVLVIGVRTIRGRRRQGGEKERDDLDG
jgi:hypothetical protein